MSSFFEVSQLTIASSAYKPPEPTSKKSTARLTSTLFHTGLLLSCHLWRCSSALLRQLRLRDAAHLDSTIRRPLRTKDTTQDIPLNKSMKSQSLTSPLLFRRGLAWAACELAALALVAHAVCSSTNSPVIKLATLLTSAQSGQDSSSLRPSPGLDSQGLCVS